jgi:type II secretory pathway pseudopilin PulG
MRAGERRAEAAQAQQQQAQQAQAQAYQQGQQAQAAKAPASPTKDVTAELQKLADLHKSGVQPTKNSRQPSKNSWLNFFLDASIIFRLLLF